MKKEELKIESLNYNKDSVDSYKSKKSTKLFSLIIVFVLIINLLFVLFFAIKGNTNLFLASIFSLFFISVLLYIALWFIKLKSK